MIQHGFTSAIFKILQEHFGPVAEEIFERSQLLQYLNFKTASANKGSKARSSFANLYAIYVVIEDYIKQGFHQNGNYTKYEGAQFSVLFKRQRELPFGEKLQNHALNNRMNDEFKKYFPTTYSTPIIRDLSTKRYWINEHLLKIKAEHKTYNIAPAILEIIEQYIHAKQSSLKQFIEQCQILQNIKQEKQELAVRFISNLLAPQTDARLFEIVSYAILKYYYQGQTIYWGYNEASVKPENLHLFKTGRTNANDGGIDFVMRPLGRFFQVTETLDFKKYFLDIDKTERFPMTFVVKSTQSLENIKQELRENAMNSYGIERVVEKYMECIEEIVNIPMLHSYLQHNVDNGLLNKVLEEIALQSKVEFYLYDEE